MDHDFLEILESNVEDISTVTIVEDRIAEGSEVVFNDQQIKSHLTNLLFDRNTQLKSLPKKVDLYYRLLKSRKTDAQNYSLLKPIIESKQYTYYTNDDDYVPDVSYEEAEMIKPSHFDKFIEQFNNFNRDVRNSYTSTAGKLYSLFRPFECDSRNKVYNDTDCVDLKGRKYRALGPNLVYGGDDINIKGFFKGTGKETKINYDEYLNQVNNLVKGNKVTVVFNDFMLNTNGNIIHDIEGIFDDIDIALSIQIRVDGVNTNKIPLKNDSYYVFKTGGEVPIFSKRSFFKGEFVIVSDVMSQYQLGKLILPSTPSQALYIEYDDVSTPNDVTYILEKYGFVDVLLPESSRPILEKLFSQKLPPKRVRVSPLSWKPIPESSIKLLRTVEGRNNLEKFISTVREKDRGLANVLTNYGNELQERFSTVNRKSIVTILEKMKVKLASYESDAAKSSCEQQKPLQLSKKYTSLEALRKDDGNVCYWDASFDKTDYKLRTEEESQSNLEKRLASIPKYSGLSAKDIQNEAANIMKGRRTVRNGDHCVLYNEILKTNLVFTRKTVQGSQIWVKVGSIDKCNETLLEEDLNDDTCLYDSLEKACKSLHESKLARRISRLKSGINYLEGAVKHLDTISEHLDKIKADFENVKLNGVVSRNLPFSDVSIFGDVEPADELEGYYIQPTFEDLFNNVEAQDYDFMPMPLDRPKDTKKSVDDFVSTICNLLEISFTDPQIKYLQGKVAIKYDIASIDEKIVGEKQKLMSKVNADMYATNMDFKKKIDERIDDKLKPLITKSYSEFYYNQILYSVALVSCMFMAMYPIVQIERIIPKCASKFSLLAFPLSGESTSSLEMYVICSLAFFAVPEDVRYQVLLGKKEDEIRTDIRKQIAELLEEDYGISQSIEVNRLNLVTSKVKNHDSETLLRTSFRPNFQFDKTDNSLIIKYLKTLNSHIKKEKFFKTTFGKSAFLSNSCCPEKLTDKIDYYSESVNDKELKSLNTSIQKSLIIPDDKRTMILKKQKLREKDETNYGGHINHKLYDIVQTQVPTSDIETTIASDEYYNKTLMPSVSTKFDNITKAMGSLSNIDTSRLVYLKDVLIMGLSDEVYNTRNSVYTFVTSKTPVLLSRLQNRYRDDKSETYTHVNNLLETNTQDLDILRSIDISSLRKVPYFEGDETVVVKNIASIMYPFVEVLEKMLTSTVLLKVCYFILSSLFDYINNTNYDIGSIEKSIENLREQRKEQMMTSYMADDEERSLQIQLRNLGVANWNTIFERIKNVDINAFANQREEQENYRMDDYQGENADGDVEEDTDFARGLL